MSLDKSKRPSEIADIRRNMTKEMIYFVWNEVLFPVSVDRRLAIGLFPDILLDEWNLVSFHTYDTDLAFKNISQSVSDAVPFILDSQYLLIFSTQRSICSELVEQLRNLEQRTPLWYFFKKMFMGCSTLGAVTLINPKYFENGTFCDYLSNCLGITKKDAPNGYSAACMQHGTVTEDIARLVYEHDTGFISEEFGIIVDPTVSTIIGYSPDGINKIVAPGQKKSVIEIKSPSSKPFACIPRYYMAQCQAGMAITRSEFCDFISFYYKPVDKRIYFPEDDRIEPPIDLKEDEAIMMTQRIYFSKPYWDHIQRCTNHFVECLIAREVPTMEEVERKMGKPPMCRSEHLKESTVIKIPPHIMDKIKRMER